MTASLIYGIDFTSAPSRAKPISCACGQLEGTRLTLLSLERWASFAPFEAWLASSGPWLAALDFPFTFARPFLERIGWPTDWPTLAAHLANMDKPSYIAAHEAFRAGQPPGQKHVPRRLDTLTRGAPPNNIVNPPVGRMLYEGVRRLHAASVAVPGLAPGDPARRVVEGYPAIAARTLIGTTAYKDGPPDSQPWRLTLRRALLDRLTQANPYGITLALSPGLPDPALDPKGEDIDAVLCAVQAAWAETHGLATGSGPPRTDLSEGWIADPVALGRPVDALPPVRPQSPERPIAKEPQ